MMNNTINEIKNSLEGINSRITEAEERISELEDKIVEITTSEQNKEIRMKRIEDSLRDLWDNIKRTNIQITGVPEEEEKKKGSEKRQGRTFFLQEEGPLLKRSRKSKIEKRSYLKSQKNGTWKKRRNAQQKNRKVSWPLWKSPQTSNLKTSLRRAVQNQLQWKEVWKVRRSQNRVGVAVVVKVSLEVLGASRCQSMTQASEQTKRSLQEQAQKVTTQHFKRDHRR